MFLKQFRTLCSNKIRIALFGCIKKKMLDKFSVDNITYFAEGIT